MSENETTQAAPEEKTPACPNCAPPEPPAEKPAEEKPACCCAAKAPSKSFLTTLIVLIVLFVLIWMGVKWYNGDFSSGDVITVEAAAPLPLNP